jgi:negative regulator of sigma E activity
MTQSTPSAACLACDEDLSAWIDGELDVRRAREVGQHVAACARCRPRISALRSVDDTLRGLADAPLTDKEAAHVARIQALLTAPRPTAGDAGFRPASPALRSTTSPAPIGAPPRRSRRLWATSLAGVAAVALAILAVPILLERAVGRSSGPGGSAETPHGEAIPTELAAREAAPSLAPEPSLAVVPRPRSRTPGHLGASAPEDPVAEPGADSAVALADFDRADLPLVVRLDALEALPRIEELPAAERRRLTERLDAPDTVAGIDRERLRDNIARWRGMPAPQRETLRARWHSHRALAESERDRGSQ